MMANIEESLQRLEEFEESGRVSRELMAIVIRHGLQDRSVDEVDRLIAGIES